MYIIVILGNTIYDINLRLIGYTMVTLKIKSLVSKIGLGR